MNNNVFLTNDILGNLCQRVAKTLPHLMQFDANSIWDIPIELCQKIENNIREVDNVILEACKNNTFYANNSNNPYNYQLLLTRVYILLYYRYSEDKLYQAFVFPELQKKMGIYNDKYLVDIQKKINDILKIDQLIKKVEQEKAHKSAPKYSIIEVPGEEEAEEYFSKFNNELLFRDVCDYLEKLKDAHFVSIDITSIWLTAKDVIRKLYQEKTPETFISRILHKLAANSYSEYAEEAAEAVILCVYMMMRTVTKTNHFNQAIRYIENLRNWEDETYLLFDEVPEIKRLMDEGLIASDDYDYLEGVQKDESTFTKADVELMMKEKDAQISSLEKQLADFKETENKKSNEQPSAHSADIAALQEENHHLKEEIADMETRQGIDAPKAALLVRIACTKLGGLPGKRENAWPLIANLWGASESISRRRLKEAIKEDTIEDLAKLFDTVSPKIAKIIREEGNTMLTNQKKVKS